MRNGRDVTVIRAAPTSSFAGSTGLAFGLGLGGDWVLMCIFMFYLNVECGPFRQPKDGFPRLEALDLGQQVILFPVNFLDPLLQPELGSTHGFQLPLLPTVAT